MSVICYNKVCVCGYCTINKFIIIRINCNKIPFIINIYFENIFKFRSNPDTFVAIL